MTNATITIPANVRSGSVMIVEDDEDMRALLKSLLHSFLFRETIGFSQLDDAVDSLEYGEFSLAIVDLNLGDRDGVSLISEIRASPRPCISSMPILVASTASTNERIAAAVRAGADAFLCKPFSVANLRRQINFACSKSAARQLKMAGPVLPAVPVAHAREIHQLD